MLYTQLAASEILTSPSWLIGALPDPGVEVETDDDDAGAAIIESPGLVDKDGGGWYWPVLKNASHDECTEVGSVFQCR